MPVMKHEQLHSIPASGAEQSTSEELEFVIRVLNTERGLNVKLMKVLKVLNDIISKRLLAQVSAIMKKLSFC